MTVTGLPRGSFIIAVTGVTRAGRARAVDRRYKACAAKSEGKEKAEREAKEKSEREAKEKAEREAKEKSEREAKEKAEREAKEKEEKEKAAPPPAGVEAGSYSGTDTQGGSMSFYVSPGGGHVQNVLVGTTVMGCTPSKSFDDHFEVASIAIDSEGDFSSTTEQEGVIEHAQAKFKYTISGHLSGASASGSMREDISFSNGTEYSCTTNALAWSLTRESVQTEASFPPAAGSYSGTDQQGGSMTFYVSPGGGRVQNVRVSTTVMGCTPSEGFDDHFEVASVAINSDGSFSSTTEQEGVLEHPPAKSKYTFSGQFHGTGSAGVVRAAGTLREDITYENSSKFECTTNGEDWSLTRESVQTEASFPPAAGSYSGTDEQGGSMTFYVSPGGGQVQNVRVGTTVMGCTPSEGFDDHFEVASVAINSDGSFSSTTEQEGVLKHLAGEIQVHVQWAVPRHRVRRRRTGRGDAARGHHLRKRLEIRVHDERRGLVADARIGADRSELPAGRGQLLRHRRAGRLDELRSDLGRDQAPERERPDRGRRLHARQRNRSRVRDQRSDDRIRRLVYREGNGKRHRVRRDCHRHL